MAQPVRASEVKNRVELLLYLIGHRDYRSYLEIGCETNLCFNEIRLADKVGVDPKSGGTLRMTSDEYFATFDRTFDLIFVDGDHQSEQIYRDVTNGLRVLSPGGAIVCHDALPELEAQMHYTGDPRVAYTGDVWRALAGLRCNPSIDIATGNFDHGCAVVLPRANRKPLVLEQPWSTLPWGIYVKNRGRLLNVMPWGSLKKWLERDVLTGARVRAVSPLSRWFKADGVLVSIYRHWRFWSRLRAHRSGIDNSALLCML